MAKPIFPGRAEGTSAGNQVNPLRKDSMETVDKRIRDKLLYETYKEEKCPVCGYYCLGKGGIGCIDKPTLCELTKEG